MVEVATKTSKMRVRAEGSLTEEFDVITGLKQGDALSPLLFNLVLEHAIRKVLALDGGVELNGKHKVIGYADDLALLGQCQSDVEAMVRTLELEGKSVGLSINRDKTEYFLMRRYKNPRQKRKDLHVDGTTYKGVDKFKYLGCTVTDTNQRNEEIDIRIQNALRCSAALHKVLVSKLISRKTKIRVYKTVIRPILMYGCEAWTLTQKEENKLLVAERKIYRKMLGPTRRDDGSWRVRKNRELEELVAEPNIIGEINSARIRWLGHLERMGEDRAVKRAYLGKPNGKRPVGRPRYRWADEAEKDLLQLQHPDWRTTAQDRDSWRLLVSEAKILFGSLSHLNTSRPPRPLEENGVSYWFVSREEMERDAHAGRFLEYGEHNGHLYGTHLDSIRAVIKEGKMCILDCAPASLKLLHNSSEFLPYVVMVAAAGIDQLRNLTYASNRNLTFDRQSSIRYSSRRARTLESLASLYEEEDMKQTLEESARIQRQYEKYIDLTIVNANTDTTYSKIMDALHKLSTDHQWVPVSWIY
ncbi:guanylate kinase domain-containing protein [Phthorimaea operculella]|nr:guanylate kinase domain-containing protein [Phthorimaea operculella]